MKIFEAGDTGPSGHGQVFRGHVKHLMDREDVEMTVRTHQWGWNRKGFNLGRPYTDTRFKEKIMRSDRFNQDYLLEEPRDISERKEDLIGNLGNASTARSEDCIIREVKEKEDIWHSVGGITFARHAEEVPDDTYTIVETDYNLNKVPREWEYWAEKADEVWVPNEWVYSAMKKRGIEDNVKVMPYGVDFSYKPTDYDCENCQGNHLRGQGNCLDDDTFTFVCVGRWYHIKGLDKLLEAFIKEFKASENVRLFLKTTMNNQAPISGEKVQQVLRKVIAEMKIPDPPEIGISTDMMDDQHFMDLMGVADAFVLPSRAECVGIAPLQAMHAGTPTILTRWSSYREYFNDRETLFVEGEPEKPRRRQPWLTYEGSSQYPPDAKWFEPDTDDLRRKLRKMYEMSQEERDEISENAEQKVHELFDWEKCMDKRVKRFRKVADK